MQLRDEPATPAGTERLFGVTLPRPLARGLAVVVALVVYLTVASVVKPGRSSAEPGVQRITPSKSLPQLRDGKDADQWVRSIVPAAPERNAHGWRLLGQMVGGERLVWIYSSPDGPRYTICTKTGEILREDLEADDVYRVFPDLDISGMRLEPRPEGGQKPESLMTADNERGG